MNGNEFVESAYGVRIPKIIYGTAWKKERTAALVEQALTYGFRGIDTAGQPKHYNESGVGEGLQSCLDAGLNRADIYLQSKFTPADGQDPLRMPYDPAASFSRQVSQSFETSLKNLHTHYLDCLVLHSPLARESELMEVWQAMETLFDTGSAKQLGISNCYRVDVLERLYCEARIKPAVLQNRFYRNTHYDCELREYCRQHGIFYQSFWTLTANPHILADAGLRKLALKYRRTPEQVFFRYLTQIHIIPLTGTTAEVHMRDDLAIFDFDLNADERDLITALLVP